MKRAQLEHIIRASGSIAEDDEIYVLGSQSILGDIPDAPDEVTVSMEADVALKNKPELEAVIEAKPDWGCDSDVFLRSSTDGRCYQVLVDYYAGGNVGGIYGEGLGGFSSRSYDFTEAKGKGIARTAGNSADKNTDRNAVKKEPTPLSFDPKDWAKHWSVDGYNEIRARITSNPPVIDVWLNGTHLTHFADTEKRLPEKGHLGIQVHGGKSWPVGAKVRYRNVQVREIAQ